MSYTGGTKIRVHHAGSQCQEGIDRFLKRPLNKRFWKLIGSLILAVIYVLLVLFLAGLVYTCPANPLSPIFNWISSLS